MRALFVSVVLLTVFASPMITQQTTLEAERDEIQYSSPIQTTISPNTGWTAGGEEITISGSGFSDLAFTNTTYDGINHQWTKTTADYGNEAGHENAMAIDSNGHVHIVHASGDGYAFTHSVYDGSSWTPTAIKNCEGSYCWDTHMVIDDNDELHAAYSTNTGLIVYMHYDGSSWTSTQVTTGAKVGPVGIALDSNNHPHISFTGYQQYCGNGLRLASFDGASWSTNIIESGSNKGCDSAIIIDGNDNAYIAFQDRDQAKLKFTTNKSGSWITYAPDSGGYNIAYPGYYSSLAMDDQGQFHIAHYDSDNDDLRYSTGVPNGAWTNTVVDSSGDTGRKPSIAIDAAGDPHIVYRSWSGWKLKYATLNPSSPNWQVSTIETTGGQGDGTGESNSLIIDDGGMMHVAYTDETNGVLRYATKSTGVTVTNEITVKFGQLGSVTADVIDDSTIRLTTPAVANPGTSTISLIDVEGSEHQLSSTFEFIDQNDLDADGIPNANDDCPDVAGTSTQDQNGCPDDDGDGYSNSGDAFPNDVLEWADTDGDGVGNNADAFPNDSSETEDSDGDGVGDNTDAFPSNAFEQIDSDGDGVGDNSDAFPNNPSETVDSDGDGVGDNADAFPQNAFEQVDSDGDGVGDNTDAFPNDSSESLDSDGDGVGDLNDLCSNTIQDAEVDGNGCSQAQLDSDGDGYLDTQDTFPLDSTQWQDSDGDGYGDNWGDSDWNDTRELEWPGIFVIGAVQADHCPDTFGNSTANGFYGCEDDDGNGIPDIFQQPETNETDDENETQTPLDSDGDGVPDIEDDCPATSSGVVVDANGCEIEETEEDMETSSGFESFFSGGADPVTTTVGVGAILLAVFTLLQTNAVAAVLPDAFRWVQVLRKNSKLTKEERNELTYLQSLVQAYYDDPKEFAEELEDLKADLTARFTNNQIKKETREKLLILIEELQSSTSNELYKIAHNDTYFGLSQVVDTDERTSLLEEKLAMSADVGEQNHSQIPPTNMLGDLDDKGTYWIEWPVSSGTWHYRYAPSETWTVWDK
ncbi:MAG: thrombospondin type 3 repeat-containing protein [Candidatus Poseidoniaceae archaeon]|nr:thrombospondin type 3 repeat-containing protein [Candidatus Poseidoniaceae archaeon]MBL6889296.1 thrombospondin type 3 repeat-containing protein [Candidatus Poseidoniaceae archaeon]